MGKLTTLPAPYYFLTSCPFFLFFYSPAIREVMDLYSWRADHCLNPNELPVLARHAVESYARGVNNGRLDNHKAKLREIESNKG